MHSVSTRKAHRYWCRPTTFRSEPNMRCDADIVTALSAIEHLQLLDPDYGIVFHHTWKRRTCRTIDSGGRWIHFCLDSGATVQSEVWSFVNTLNAPFRNNHIYLLYLLTYLFTCSVRTQIFLRVCIQHEGYSWLYCDTVVGRLQGAQSRPGRPSVGSDAGRDRVDSRERGHEDPHSSNPPRSPVARLREPPLQHVGPRLLLHHRVLHNRLCDDQHHWDSAVWSAGPDVRRRPVSDVWRAVWHPTVLRRHRLRHYFHPRVPRTAIRRAKPTQASTRCLLNV